MDLNNITNSINGKVNETREAEQGRKAEGKQISESKKDISDKVTLDSYNFKKNEQLFARIELEKLNQSQFDKLKSYKAKISEYEAAVKISPEAAKETDLGKLLDNPDVWDEIANRIIE